jgi:hypothetical protein
MSIKHGEHRNGPAAPAAGIYRLALAGAAYASV